MSRDSDPPDLARLEHLASLGRLATAMLHDMSQPASMALFLVSLLERDLSRLGDALGECESLEQRRLVEDLGTTSKDLGFTLDHLRSLLQQGKALGRDPAPSMHSVSLSEVGERSLRLMRPALDGRCEVRVELGDLPPVLGNFTELMRVVINLVDNAMRAVEGMQPLGVITIRTFTDGSEVVLEVEDNGSGIPAVISTRVFDPFVSTRGSGGLGLGLWASSRIVEAHGGRLCFGEEREAGALFRLSIPATAAEVAL
jgi:signal transduction histidine kinase